MASEATSATHGLVDSTREEDEGTSQWFEVLTGPIARFLFALPFLMFGVNHFLYADQMSGMVPGWLPASTFWVYLTGAALIAAAGAIMFQKLARTACLLLALMLATFVATIHLPGLLNEATMQQSMVSLLKDTALAGGALLFARYSSER